MNQKCYRCSRTGIDDAKRGVKTATEFCVLARLIAEVDYVAGDGGCGKSVQITLVFREKDNKFAERENKA